MPRVTVHVKRMVRYRRTMDVTPAQYEALRERAAYFTPGEVTLGGLGIRESQDQIGGKIEGISVVLAPSNNDQTEGRSDG